MVNIYKNVEIANLYLVAEKTVGNWITQSIQGKNNLELAEVNGRLYIINNINNQLILESLSSKGRKYKNKKFVKTVTPSPDFYKIFTYEEQIEIISNLETHSEISTKYRYFGKGAYYWSQYIDNYSKENNSSLPNITIKLLDDSLPLLLNQIEKYKLVNVYDLGSGNGFSVVEFLDKLNKTGKLNKYFAVDISSEMIDICKSKLSTVLTPNQFNSIKIDFEKTSFLEHTYKEKLKSPDTINVLLLLGTTIENVKKYDKILYNIVESMSGDDIFILDQLIKTERNKNKSYMVPSNESTTDWASRLRTYVLDLLNIKENFYEIEKPIDPMTHARYGYAVCNFDIEIKFESPLYRKTLRLEKKQKILRFRHGKHFLPEVINELDKAGFDVIYCTTSLDGEQMLSISRLKL